MTRIRLSWGRPYGISPNLSRNADVTILVDGKYKYTGLFIAAHPKVLADLTGAERYRLWNDEVELLGTYSSLKKAKEAALTYLMENEQ